MRNVKNITAGVAILLCIFICIYILTLYLKFTPEEPKLLEDGTYEEIDGKIKQFLDSDVNIKEHLTLVFLLAFSAAAGFLLEKLPAFGMVTSALPLSYALTMLRFDALPKFPMSVITLCLVHAVGAVFFAATSERGNRSFLGLNSAASGGMICNIAAIGLCAYICPILQRFAEMEEKIAILKENSLILSTRIAAIPDVVDMVWRAFEMHGTEKAREALTSIIRQSESNGIEAAFSGTYLAEEFPVYLRLAILLFGIVILSLVFRRRAFVGAILSVIPPIYVFGNMMYDKISTATLILLTLTIFGAIGAFAAYQRQGQPALVDGSGDELEVEDEDDPLPEEIPASDAEDGAENEDLPDWECDKLDYFYEKPKYEPEPEEISSEERDEYLEIEENNDGDQKEDTKQP
ncbi:MAG: hypothetical protein IJF21_02335 [Clostridia bacterium]|nr:hypothetical protein [Clostridia bacterium]